VCDYTAGASLAKLARRHNCRAERIRRELVRAGVDLRSRPLSDAERERIRAAHANGRSAEFIADWAQRPLALVRQVLA
jgi:sugar/nucleoside kinase (ribokinase family)